MTLDSRRSFHILGMGILMLQLWLIGFNPIPLSFLFHGWNICKVIRNTGALYKELWARGESTKSDLEDSIRSKSEFGGASRGGSEPRSFINC